MPMFLPGVSYAGSGTFAAKPAATAVPAGTVYRASDVGENGTWLESNGTRWRAFNGAAALKTLGNATGNIANSETIVLQTQIPIGAWQANDLIRIAFTGTKSGATDFLNATVRVGTAGTTADTAITGLSSYVALGGTNRSGGFIFDLKLVSATSVQRLGNAGAAATSYAGGTNTTLPAATAVTDASANALYVSLGIASSGATDTVSLQSCSIHLITP